MSRAAKQEDVKMSCECRTERHKGWALVEAPQKSVKRTYRKRTKASNDPKLAGRATSVPMKKNLKEISAEVAEEKESDSDSDFY